MNTDRYKADTMNTARRNISGISEMPKRDPNNSSYVSKKRNINIISLPELSSISKEHPNDILLTILDKHSGILTNLNESSMKPDLSAYMFIVIGKACSSDMSANVNSFIQAVNCNSKYILLHMQRYLVSLQKQESLEKYNLDSILFLTVFLEKFQSIMPSTSSDFMSILLPLLESTCEKGLKVHEDIYRLVLKKLKEVNERNQHFLKQHSLSEMRKVSETEKLHLQEPPESFRLLPILPTAEDIHLPCSFLRPNIVQGKYKSTEHYLDVQYRLLREDYIKPLRDGIAEYLDSKKTGKSFKNCKNCKIYTNVHVIGELFLKGDMLHVLKFSDEGFSKIKWDCSKRLMTQSLLCLSSNNFQTMLFASVIHRDLEKLEKGFLYVRFEEITKEVLNLNRSMNFDIIETSAYFESYRHNLFALQQLDAESLPLKEYIVGVKKTVSCPRYLQSATTYDMRPLLLPLDEKLIEVWDWDGMDCFEYPEMIHFVADAVNVLNESSWPTATDFNLDSSQYSALKSAVTKEFSIIQGPPGTGKTYIGLRIVQLLLHNLSKWFSNKTNSLPILIVCHTNHALDQFLEGLLLFTTSIARIGGGCKNERIVNYYSLRCLKRNSMLPEHISNNIFEANMELRQIRRRINKINEFLEIASNSVLNEYELKNYIPCINLNSLKNHSRQTGRQSTSMLYDWLGISLYSRSVKGKVKLENNLFDNSFESEDEADIEYIENQRNLDFFDFDEFLFNKKTKPNFGYFELNDPDWSHEDSWITQESKKEQFEMAKYVKHCLKHFETMKEDIALQVNDVWNLDYGQRWKLYKFWLDNFTKEMSKEYLELKELLKEKFQEVEEMRSEEAFHALRTVRVLGMTTSGAAKYRKLVQRLNPTILVVEEAAEVLESHIVTSLAPNTQHVILIGDQQQLRPSPTVHMLAVKYDLNISLFERMVANGVDYCRLSVQHRMRPDIAALIVPHIYPELENHKVVTEFENIKGLDKNVYFVSHSFNESPESDSKSKVNEYEAKFLIQLCRYLLLQGYAPSQITVLTPYIGQLFVLKNLATGDVKKIRFTAVDNFQGEENDIILISFVRSNDDCDIGFLNVSNRVCVALSRAKKGLYCIGNFSLLAEKSVLWKNIIHTLKLKQGTGLSLRLMCQNHPDVYNDASCEADFINVSEGGCNRKCEYRLPCGHTCQLMCHPYDQDHAEIVCKKQCIKTCERGHPCERRCPEKCYCEVLVDRTLNKCEHTVKAICGKPEVLIICSYGCKKLLPCSHKCPNLCGVSCETKCKEKRKKICKSGHQYQKMCFEFNDPCNVPVDKILKLCGHTVKALCVESDYAIKCSFKCDKILNCTHQCPKKCGERCETMCKEQRLKTCDKGHQCQKKCFEFNDLCNVSVDKILKRCGHTMKALCGENDYEIECSFKCGKILNCTHECPKKCGERCETMCKEQCLKTCDKGHQCQKKCFESCGSCEGLMDKTLVLCGHTIKVPCKDSDLNDILITCSSICGKKLKCNHICRKKCGEYCEEICMQLKEIVLPTCGHFEDVPCYVANSSEILKKRCSEEFFRTCFEPCKEILSCGHKCSGTCGNCYQKRLHILCEEACERILLCGHRCQSVCSTSCPPCQRPCENKCIHSICRKKCGEPCNMCTNPCEWACSHKVCTMRCSEICNREPCTESCMEILPCGHLCIGFCGEPCPKLCRICDNKTEDSIFYTLEDNAKYVLLEDCGHVFEEHGLNRWFALISEGDKKIRMKTCPMCKTVIRNNFRYNTIVKNSILELENIKQIIEGNTQNNEQFQNILLQKSLSLNSLSYFKPYNNLNKFLSSCYIRNPKELTNIENVISIGTGLNLSDIKYACQEFSNQPQFLRSLADYTRITSQWVADFILEHFLSISEQQLVQLAYEVRRLGLIGRLLQHAEPKFVYSRGHNDLKKCSRYLLNDGPFKDDSIKAFNAAFQVLTSKYTGNTGSVPTPIEFPYLKAMDMSAGHWYKCSKGHAYSVVEYVGTVGKGCYECTKKKNVDYLPNCEKSSHTSSKRRHLASPFY